MRWQPKLSMNVDLPTPGEPLMPAKRSDSSVCLAIDVDHRESRVGVGREQCMAATDAFCGSVLAPTLQRGEEELSLLLLGRVIGLHKRDSAS